MIPPPRQRGATVLVNGSARQLRVQGSPTWRTMINVDGVTVYDKFPGLYGKSYIKFDFIPGKPANLRWYKTAGQQLEYQVTVDGVTTTLASLESAAISKASGVFELRAGGVFLLAVAAFSFYLNRQSLLESDQYYPKSLAMIPFEIFGGLVSLLYPSKFYPAINNLPKNKAMEVVAVIFGIGVGAFGFTVFTGWFLATFSKR